MSVRVPTAGLEPRSTVSCPEFFLLLCLNRIIDMIKESEWSTACCLSDQWQVWGSFAGLTETKLTFRTKRLALRPGIQNQLWNLKFVLCLLCRNKRKKIHLCFWKARIWFLYYWLWVCLLCSIVHSNMLIKACHLMCIQT